MFCFQYKFAEHRLVDEKYLMNRKIIPSTEFLPAFLTIIIFGSHGGLSDLITYQKIL